MTEKYKSIQIRTETYEALAKMGNVADTFDSVVSRLLKKTMLQPEFRRDSDQTATETMNQPFQKEEHSYE